MIKSEQVITELKYIVKRRLQYYMRKRQRLYKPLFITGAKLRKKKIEYDEIINSLIEQIKQYCSSAESVHAPEKGTVLFENFKILSYNGDRMGKVFSRDGRIYRGIYEESVPAFQKLWESGILQVLGSNGYVPVTTITDFYTDEYPIIIEHQVVDMYTSKSWNALMIKDACITMGILRRVLETFGFTLHDGHLNNLTFHNGRPVFTDIGSFVQDEGQKTGYGKGLVFAGLYRLLFIEINNSILKRVQAFDEENNSPWVSPRFYDDATFEYYKALKAFKRYHFWHSSPRCSWIIFRLFDCYDERPEFIELLFGKMPAAAADCQQAAADVQPVVSALEKLQLDIASAVDIGGTSGELSLKLHENLKIKVLSADYDEARSVKAYERFKNAGAPVNTMIFHYLYGADDGTRDFVRSDLAVALDITHNLRTYQEWKPDSLINSLSKMTEKYAAVTFYPDDQYSIADFESSFSGFFEIIHRETVKPIDGGQDGVLLVGRK